MHFTFAEFFRGYLKIHLSTVMSFQKHNRRNIPVIISKKIGKRTDKIRQITLSKWRYRTIINFNPSLDKHQLHDASLMLFDRLGPYNDPADTAVLLKAKVILKGYPYSITFDPQLLQKMLNLADECKNIGLNSFIDTRWRPHTMDFWLIL